MRTEVTNSQYARCVSAGACTPPKNSRWNDPRYASYPVTDVTWQQANAYARWVGGRLPTEAEWEAACRGGIEQVYPWGDSAPTAALANFGGSRGGPVAVGAYPDGASPYGVLDMAGNVAEWTSTLYKTYPYYSDDGREDLSAAGSRVIRGGSYADGSEGIRCAHRVPRSPDLSGDFIGFRVARDRLD
ncbi:MAG: formylglycine-generating enzyme family protein [Anaerolineae bacterium]